MNVPYFFLSKLIFLCGEFHKGSKVLLRAMLYCALKSRSRKHLDDVAVTASLMKEEGRDIQVCALEKLLSITPPSYKAWLRFRDLLLDLPDHPEVKRMVEERLLLWPKKLLNT
jgi:hypothetical protein